jgi:UDP-2,3-diacylglucosamine hydrolase
VAGRAPGSAPPEPLVPAPVWRSQLRAPRHWQAIDFVSDLHLSPATPQTALGFARWIANTDADAVVILGDLFEVWIGDDVDPASFESEVLALLSRASRERVVAMMVGNRDFLVSPALLAAHGVVALDDVTALQAFEETVLLTHGDALCLADTDYQHFRRQVRSSAWQAEFLAKPRAERAALARALRDGSEARKRSAEPVTWADADPRMTMDWLAAHGARTMVHGHTHRPFSHAPAVTGAANGTHRHVLSDWDLDAPVRRADVLRLSEAGFARSAPRGA